MFDAMSRRNFLAVSAATLAVAACARPAPRPTVDVREYGAKGDGVTDDSSAIAAAVAALKPGATLLFPSGTYRFAERRPTGGAAIVLSDVSDVVVQFEGNAELLVDNLDAGSTGTGHGVLVRGPASNITLRDVRIRWAAQPVRSQGDGIRIVGLPADAGPVPAGWTQSGGPVHHVELTGCSVESSPQAGIIMMGVSDITVSNSRAVNTAADGLHFNACRRAAVANHHAENCGDDGLALVTYHTDEDGDAFGFDDAAATFSFGRLTDWSNADFRVRDVSVDGGDANGVRLAGANRVSLTRVDVRGCRDGSGIMIDSAAPGADDTDWQYVASRGMVLAEVRIANCDTGIHLLARPQGATDDRFNRFDVDVSRVDVDTCTNWSILAESLSGQRVTGMRLHQSSVVASSTSGGSGGVGLQMSQDVDLGSMTITREQPVLALTAVDSNRFSANYVSVVVTGGADYGATAQPCVQFDGSNGVVQTLNVRWKDAPPSWAPVSVTNGADCRGDGSAPAVDIRSLRVTPRTISTQYDTC